MMLKVSQKSMYVIIIITSLIFQIIVLSINVSAASDKEIEKLIKRLDHRIIQSRVSAAKRLGEIGPAAKDAVPALEKALDDESESVRKAAADALRKIGTPEALKAVQDYETQKETPIEMPRESLVEKQQNIRPRSNYSQEVEQRIEALRKKKPSEMTEEEFQTYLLIQQNSLIEQHTNRV